MTLIAVAMEFAVPHPVAVVVPNDVSSSTILADTDVSSVPPRLPQTPACTVTAWVAHVGAAGSAIGILTGSAAGMILCILLLAGSKREIRKQIRRDPTKRKEDITGLFRLLISILFPVCSDLIRK